MGDKRMDVISLKILSSDKFDFRNISDELILSIDKQFELRNYNIAFFLSNEVAQNQWIIETTGQDIGYIAFMLNDIFTLRSILGTSFVKGKRFRVSKSMLSNIKIPLPEAQISSYYSIMEILFQRSFRAAIQNDSERLNLDLLSSIRLALSFELHQYQIMQKLKISILEHWKKLVDNHKVDLAGIFEELMSPTNELMSNVKRFQLFLGIIEKGLKDGLATE